MPKKKASKSVFYGPADGFFLQKKKIVLENVKHLGNKKDIFLNKSGLGNNIFSNIDSLFGDKKSANITGINDESFLDLAVNTLKTKHVNTGAVFSSPLGSSNFDINNDMVFFFCLSIFLNKKLVDPKITKTQVEVSVKKSFTLDINLSTVNNKSATAKMQLIRKLFLTVNGFGEATIFSKFEKII
ncbi:hypothetical protein G9A89_018634 [Geosiphon pyriformis]|nr:hypothetical protein G9A89_018634 [Geosiphon pyriformis]